MFCKESMLLIGMQDMQKLPFFKEQTSIAEPRFFGAALGPAEALGRQNKEAPAPTPSSWIL
jgi:hypothetical protein